jgi:thioredoxin 1
MADTTVDDLAQLDQAVRHQPAVLAYFTGPNCNVCKVVKPMIAELLDNKFAEIAFYSIDCDTLPQAASQYGVLTIPTVVLYFDGKETTRLVRNFSIGELEQAISRPYKLLFTE